MTIGTTIATITAAGNGVTTSFSYPFLIPAASDAQVVYIDAAGTQTYLLPTQYTISGIGIDTGGAVTYPLSGSPIAAGTTLTISRVLPLVQTTSIANEGPTFAATEGALDTLEMQIQQIAGQVSGAIPIPTPGSYVSFPTIAALRANAAAVTLAFVVGYRTPSDGGGGPFAVDPTDVTSADNGVTIIVDQLGQRWRRDYAGPVSLSWTGADPTGATDCAALIQTALSASLSLYIPRGTYLVASTVTLPVGATIFGDGAEATIIRVAFNGFAFARTNGALAETYVTVRDLGFDGASANAYGISFTLCETVRMQNLSFSGVQITIELDRGRWFYIEDIDVRGNASYGCGQLKLWSSSDADYCFLPEIRNYNVNTGILDPGVVQSYVSPAIYVRRVVGLRLFEPNIDRGDVGTPGIFILIENDCQGTKIIGGGSHGCTYGILLRTGTGVAVGPGYTDIISHDVDVPQAVAIASVCDSPGIGVALMIMGGKLTSCATGATYLYFNNIQNVSLSNILITDYTGSHFGTGLLLGSTVDLTMTGCIFKSIHTAWDFSLGVDLNLVMTNNIIDDCVAALSGGAPLANGTSWVANNKGLNPNTIFSLTPAPFPISGTTTTNTSAFSCWVYISGGTISAVTVDGTSVAGAGGGPYLLSPGGTIVITYTGSPVWTWIGL